jgi:hypothetical protein
MLLAFYALLFNGVACALLTSDVTFSNLTKLQRALISNKSRCRCMSICIQHCLSGSSRYRGSQRRARRQATCSCVAARLSASAVLVALKYFEILREGSRFCISLFTLREQSLPALLAVAVPLRYHGNSAGAARHTSDAGASLLQTGTQSHTS